MISIDRGKFYFSTTLSSPSVQGEFPKKDGSLALSKIKSRWSYHTPTTVAACVWLEKINIEVGKVWMCFWMGNS